MDESVEPKNAVVPETEPLKSVEKEATPIEQVPPVEQTPPAPQLTEQEREAKRRVEYQAYEDRMREELKKSAHRPARAADADRSGSRVHRPSSDYDGRS